MVHFSKDSSKYRGKLVCLEDIIKIEPKQLEYFNTGGSINYLAPERYQYFEDHGFFGKTSIKSDIWELIYCILYVIDVIIIDEFFDLLYNNFEILEKLCEMSEYDDVDILNLSIEYIFSNYLLNYNNIKDIFSKANLSSYSIFSYIQSMNNIMYINTLKNLVNFLLGEYLLNDNKNPISILLNTNKIFLEKSVEYTTQEKLEMIYNNNIILRKRVLISLFNDISGREDCNINLIINLIKYIKYEI